MLRPKYSYIYFLIVLSLLISGVYFGSLSNGYSRYSELTLSQLMDAVKSGEVEGIRIRGNDVRGKLSNGTLFKTHIVFYPSFIDDLRQNGTGIEVIPLETPSGVIVGMILSWLPMIAILVAWLFFMRQLQIGGAKAMSFGKSKAKMWQSNLPKVTFADVAGVDEARDELLEIVDFLKNRESYEKLGAKIPKGVLLAGPPGTGKTLLARAIAGEADVPFFNISGSDFVEVFVGVGASRVRDMFEQAKKKAPCIVFIDEVDAVGRHRGVGNIGGGSDEREQTLNQLLVEMDGFVVNEGVIIIGATNRPEALDSALLRPGRFDRRIFISLPDVNGREQILKVHAGKISIAPGVDFRILARATPGFSGADLFNIINEGAILASRNRRDSVDMKSLEFAKDKVTMGAERRSLIIKDEDKKIIAYHEAGHALLAYFLPNSDAIYKATIIPRGAALGQVVRLPEDRMFTMKDKLIADITVCVGGRVAEALIFGEEKITAGARSDIKQATSIARAIVAALGMDDDIGFVDYVEEDPYKGRITSGKTLRDIEDRVKRLIDECYEDAVRIMKSNINALHRIASALLKYETLSLIQIRMVVDNESVDEKELLSLHDEEKEPLACSKAADGTKNDECNDKSLGSF